MNLSDERDRLDFADNAHRLQPVHCNLWRILGYIGVVVVLAIVVWSRFRIGADSP
jgi:hypothetical protein